MVFAQMRDMFGWPWTGLILLVCMAEGTGFGACEPCTSYGAGTSWGTVSAVNITEASGLAASRRNPGVLWTHNDGAKQKIFAISTNGTLLATFDLNQQLVDVEDLAVGPGPQPGVSYMYVGDIGASGIPNEARTQLRVLRLPEPEVALSWASNPGSFNFDSVETFELEYPDRANNAEALMLDPVSNDLLIATKDAANSRVYSIRLPNTPAAAALPLSFVISLNFGGVSAGDISMDGSRIVLRREDLAMAWARCESESMGAALGRAGKSVPVVGPPVEANGEGICFLPDNSGYVTISEGANPVVYYFASSCPMAPMFLRSLKNVSTFAGGAVEFVCEVAGFPAPTYQWRLNGQLLSASGNALQIPNVTTAQAGIYEVTASNASGTAVSSATLEVRDKPDLRITEVQSSTAPSPGVPNSDWWELTSFEPVPVSLAGWRFNDSSGGLLDPFVIPNVVIQPRESVVFVEDLTPDQFRAWWGAGLLPPNLQIITYQGAGLSLSATGDGVRLWSDVAANDADTVAQVDFGSAINGVSFNYDPATGTFGQPSVVGVNGVVTAALGPDIGSPGRILGPPASPALTIEATGGSVSIRFQSSAGYRYQLESRGSLVEGAWIADGGPILATSTATLSFERVRDSSVRFYRVRVE